VQFGSHIIKKEIKTHFSLSIDAPLYVYYSKTMIIDYHL